VAIVASGFSRKALAAAALVATIILGAQTWHKAFRVDGNDLTSYLLAARALWDGQSPYGLDTPFPYLYPLFLAFAIVPFALLPYGAAVIGWYAASVAALGLILREWASRNELAIAATVLVTFNVIQNNLLNGQVNFFVVLCCVAAVVSGRPSAFAQRATGPPEGGHYAVADPPEGGLRLPAGERRETVAGLWLGVGIALKLMPALLLVYFLVRRQGRAILVAAATALALALVPSVLIIGGPEVSVESGFSRITAVHAQYLRQFLSPMMTSPAGDELAFSIASVVARAFGVGPALWLEVLCAAAVLGTVAFVDVARWRRRGDDVAAAAAYLVAIILISPKSETHHLAVALPAVALCVSRLFGDGGFTQAADMLRLRALRVPALTLLVSALALVTAPFSGAAEGPMVTTAMILLIAAVTGVSGRSKYLSEHGWSTTHR
jgi:alpha-1,2-mannosyltransferase